MDTAKQRTRRHTFVRLGALWLVIVGVVQLAIGTWLFPKGDGCQTASCLEVLAAAVIGFPLLALGAAQVLSGVGVWRWRRWGRVLGIVLAALGLVVSLLFLGADEWWRLPSLLAVGYAVTLVALVYWVSHAEAS